MAVSPTPILRPAARKTTIRESDLPPELREWVKGRPDAVKREIQEPKVVWCKIVGANVVDEREWPGKWIPVVPFIGEETIIDGIMDRKGHTRYLIDPQRIYNYWSPLDLATPLPTPTGWTTMGKVEVGQWLLDENGKPVKVLGTSPIHINRKCFKVTFDDGTHIVADAEHLWTVEEKGKRKLSTWDWQTKTISTEQLTPRKHFIYTTKPLDLPEISDLPIHPYALGAWLGDGDSNGARITTGFDDTANMWACLNATGHAISEPMVGNEASNTIRIYNIHKHLQEMNLLQNKHIPGEYLRASTEQRWQLLRGLMDTDGSINTKLKQCSFTTVSPKIADGFSELLRTLGIKAVFIKKAASARMFPHGQICQTQEAFQFSFSAGPNEQIFNLKRKADIQMEDRPYHVRRTKRHRIKSIEEVPSVPVKCVTIDSESHLSAWPGLV